MTLKRQFGFAQWLPALALVLSFMGASKHAHRQQVAHAPVHTQHQQSASTTRSGRGVRATGAAAGHGDTTLHVLPGIDPPPALADAVVPEFAFSASVVSFEGDRMFAVVSSGRTPGSPRGPPSLS